MIWLHEQYSSLLLYKFWQYYLHVTIRVQITWYIVLVIVNLAVMATPLNSEENLVPFFLKTTSLFYADQPRFSLHYCAS